jgi:enoyl-CoA hydratase/carnithine racemase
MIDLQDADDGVVVVRMDHGDNCFTPGLVDALQRALDAVEARPDAAAVVLTGTDKRFSFGIDLGWVAEAGGEGRDRLVAAVQGLFARLLAFPLPTVAALNGHAFGGGAMLALACDQRVMRGDRGWFALPELDFGLPFTDGMAELIRSRLGPRVAAEAVLTGRRYDAEAALAAGIADAVAPEAADVVPAAVARAARAAGRDRAIVAATKRQLHREALELLATSRLDRSLLPAG